MCVEAVGAAAELSGPRGRHHVSVAVVAFEKCRRELRRTWLSDCARLRPRERWKETVESITVRHLRQGGQGRQVRAGTGDVLLAGVLRGGLARP